MADNEINVNALPVKTAPAAGDKMLMIGAAEEYQIDYDQLASAILDKLSTKQYSELDTTAKTVLGALDELNGKSINLFKKVSVPANTDTTIVLEKGCFLLTVYDAFGAGPLYFISDGPSINGAGYIYKLAQRDNYYDLEKGGNKYTYIIKPGNAGGTAYIYKLTK